MQSQKAASKFSPVQLTFTLAFIDINVFKHFLITAYINPQGATFTVATVWFYFKCGLLKAVCKCLLCLLE